MKRTPDPPEELLDGDEEWPAAKTCVGEAEANLVRGFLEANGFDFRERLADVGVGGDLGVTAGPRITFFVCAHQYAAAKRALDPNAFLEDEEVVPLAEPEYPAQIFDEKGNKVGPRILGLPKESVFVVAVVMLLLSLVLISAGDWFLCGVE